MKKKSEICSECVRFGRCISAQGKNPFWNFVIRDWRCFEPAGCLMVSSEQETTSDDENKSQTVQ